MSPSSLSVNVLYWPIKWAINVHLLIWIDSDSGSSCSHKVCDPPAKLQLHENPHHLWFGPQIGFTSESPRPLFFVFFIILCQIAYDWLDIHSAWPDLLRHGRYSLLMEPSILQYFSATSNNTSCIAAAQHVVPWIAFSKQTWAMQVLLVYMRIFSSLYVSAMLRFYAIFILILVGWRDNATCIFFPLSKKKLSSIIHQAK